jgi:hypothetical protein
MKQANPTEDSFEKARRAFFGAEKMMIEPNATPTEFPNTPSESSRIAPQLVGSPSKLR